MKTFFFLCIAFVIVSCGNSEPKVTPEQQQAMEQVSKDQAAMDSMEAAIKSQIEAVSDDSLMKTNH